jgi:FkbM family methyltransferase
LAVIAAPLTDPNPHGTAMTDSPKRPIAFVLASTHHGSMLVNRHGYGVGYQLLNTSAFDPNEVDVAKKLLLSRRQNFGDGVVALDCGANLGVHTLEWAKFMTGWGSVIAIEAQERIFYALAGNIALNNCFNARAIWSAVGEESGTIGVPVPDYFSPSSFGSLEIRKKDTTEFIGQQINYENTQPVTLITIDGMNFQRLDFVKIDIEGMEMEALRGAAESIRKFRPVLMIEKIKSSETEITGFLKDQGYQIFPLGINILAVHDSDPVSKHIQVTASKP